MFTVFCIANSKYVKGEIKSIILVSQALLKHGHRVRVVTHADFQSFVLKAGFESFSFSNDAQYPMAVSN